MNPNKMGGFGDSREYSEETAKVIDEEIKKMIDGLYEETRKILEANRDRLDALAKALLRKLKGTRTFIWSSSPTAFFLLPAGRVATGSQCCTAAWFRGSTRGKMKIKVPVRTLLVFA